MSRSTSPSVLRQIQKAFEQLRMSSTTLPRPSDEVEAAKWRVAEAAVSSHVRSGMRIGVGTGSTAFYLVHHLGHAFRAGTLKDIVCVPSSFSARTLIVEAGLPLSDLERTPELDLCIDGADEVDPRLSCIKGGGGCLTQEKIVQSAAKKFVVIADHRKASEKLGRLFPRLPIEVIPFAYRPVQLRIQRELGGKAELRMASKKAGPVITDSGNYLLDWTFPQEGEGAEDWARLHSSLKAIPGVVETGLFVGVTHQAMFGQLDGSVTLWDPPAKANGHH